MEQWIMILESPILTNVFLFLLILLGNNIDKKLGFSNRIAYRGVYKEELGE